MSLLRVSDLSMRFGGLLAVDGVNFTVEPSEIFAVIGPNGAGKTTVFNCISGFYRATAGRILLQRSEDEVVDLIEVLGTPLQPRDAIEPGWLLWRLYYQFCGGSHHVARAGVARTFQNLRLFRNMTVVENLLVAQHTQL